MICGNSECLARYERECYEADLAWEHAYSRVESAYDWDLAEAYAQIFLISQENPEESDEIFFTFEREMEKHDLDFECLLPANWDKTKYTPAEAMKSAVKSVEEHKEWLTEKLM